MISKLELMSGIEELINGKHTIQNCEKLACLYIVLDHLYPQESEDVVMDKGYSFDMPNNVIGDYGDSEFAKLISGRTMDEVIPLIDDLVTTIQVLNPRLYSSFIRNLTEKR